MKLQTAVAIFALGGLLTPLAAHATESDADRSHPVAFVKDSIVTTKIKAKLAAEKMYSFGHVKVETDRDGAVVLSGTARSQRDADKAVSIAQDTDGAKSVKSSIRIKKED
jgi:hyperosmotically inducible protein